MRFLDLNNLLHAGTETTCSKEEILEALDGVFFWSIDCLLIILQNCIRGGSCDEFRHRYIEKAWQCVENSSDHVQENLHANTLYDQSWMFALAISASLPTIASKICFIGSEILGIVKSEFKRFSFQGASGWIQFNEQQEVSSFTGIFQFQNGTPVWIGVQAIPN